MTKTDIQHSIENWLKGDDNAFSDLFYYYHLRLSRFSEKFISDHQVREELVMNVLLKVWQARHRITDINSFNGYLYKAMRNELISSFRRKRTTLLPLEKLAIEPSLQTEYEYDALLKEYASTIERLPPKRRQIFLMSRSLGMTHLQIAEELRISPNTVQKQVSAALGTIRKELGLGSFFCLVLAGILS